MHFMCSASGVQDKNGKAMSYIFVYSYVQL